MKLNSKRFNKFALITCVLVILTPVILWADIDKSKTTASGELTFTIRTVTANGNYSPKHVLAIWIEDVNGFVKTRKAMANQRKQYLYTWHAASNYNVVDAITGVTLTSHQTHTVVWDCTDLDGNIVPDGDYVVWVEFTDKHDQGPLFNLTFTKGPDAQFFTPPEETYFKDIELEFTPLVCDFSTDATDICQSETVTFTDESVNASSWSWNFGDGTSPATSTTQGPHTVSYASPGLKTVSLTINGDLTEMKEDFINVSVSPTADFSFSGSELTVDFINNSINATSYLWDFGDGNTSTDNNPTHTYAEVGSYYVTLTSSYLGCEDMTSMEVMLPLVGLHDSEFSNYVSIFPNPNTGYFILNTGEFGIPEKVVVYNQAGDIVWQRANF
ncbi:MAG: DUF2271 domain-containing protein, partial [Bacteroidales bacterium]